MYVYLYIFVILSYIILNNIYIYIYICMYNYISLQICRITISDFSVQSKLSLTRCLGI